MLESLLQFLNGIIHSKHPEPILPHAHDPALVVVSILIAILAAYVALDLAAQVTAKRGRARYLWLGWGAVAMGTGIWSMNFAGRLSFRLPNLAISYDVVLVIVSLMAAIVASGLALYITTQPQVRGRDLAVGGLLMGAGISGMHNIGTAAMRLSAIIHLETVPFIISILVAVSASYVALWLQFRLRSAATWRAPVLKVLAAVVMGLAIAGMHYTGMWASVFHAHPEIPAHPPGSVEISVLGGVAIAVGAILVLGIAVLLSLLDRRLARLTYPQKFALISLLFVLPPLGAFYPMLNGQLNRIEQYGRLELYGTFYLRPLYRILEGAHRHQLAAEAYLDGNVTREELAQLQTRIDESFQNLEQVDQKYGTALQVGTAASVLNAQWQALKASTSTLSKPDLLLRHAQLIEEIQKVIVDVGDNSYLILDPDLDTYYMMDAVLLKLPESQVLLVQTLALGEEVAAQETLTADERTQLIILTGRLRSDLLAMNDNVGRGLAANAAGSMAPLVEVPLQAASADTGRFLDLVEARIINARALQVSPDELVTAGEAALNANVTLYDAASLALETGLRARIARLTNALVYAAAVAGVGVAVAFLFGFLVIRSINRPLVELAGATQRLGEGDMTTRVVVSTEYEVGRVGRAFNNMAETLQASQQRVESRTRALAASAEVSRRLSTLLDPKQLALSVVEEMQRAFNYYHAHIYFWDEPRENLVLAGGTGEAGLALLARGHQIPRGRGLVGRAAETNTTILVPDVSQDPGWLPNPLLPETTAEVAVPIAAGDQVLGVLDVQHNLPNGLAQADADLLRSVADQVAIALQNARLYSQAQQQAERETQVNVIAQKIQGATTVESVLQVAVQELGRALNAERASAQLGKAKTTGNGNGTERRA
jgi:NO-binding membrane sensor protein with MHYT domain/putative methionine-R-sulfoxide reductase with GAF domain